MCLHGGVPSAGRYAREKGAGSRGEGVTTVCWSLSWRAWEGVASVQVGCEIHTIYVFSCTPSPCTHTHVVTPPAHEHRVSHRVPLTGEAKGAQVAGGSWGGRDGVDSTPRHALQQPNFPCFRHLRALGARLSAPAHPDARAIGPLHTGGTPDSQWRATDRQTRWLQQQSGGEAREGRCSKREAFASRGGVSSRCPYLRTTRPSGRVSCGGSAKRIGGGQARKRGKKGKPVAQRVATTTA